MDRTLCEILLLWILVSSVAELVLCGYDKMCAKLGWWRIPEKVLLGLAVIGGGLGLGAGMQLFRHKTQHTSFKIVGTLTCVFYIMAIGYMVEKIC